MSIQHYPLQYRPTSPLVDKDGIPILGYGSQFFTQIYNRSGLGTGIVPIVSKPLTATGSTIADALQLQNDWNDIESGGAGSGVAIAAALSMQPGNDIWVFNGSGSTKNVYPPSSSVQIDQNGNGNPFVLNNLKLRCFQCWSTGAPGGIIFRSYGN